MKTINPNVYPKDGHHFIERDGAKIVGDSWNGVIARVVRYRKRAGYPEGDPRTEVINQACQRNPIICAEDNGANQQELTRASLKSRILAFLQGLRVNKPQLVDDSTALGRANICARCPKNQPLQDGCSSCRAAVQALREEIVGRRTFDGRLNACTITGEDLPSAAFMELQAQDNGNLPEHCWRRRKL